MWDFGTPYTVLVLLNPWVCLFPLTMLSLSFSKTIWPDSPSNPLVFAAPVLKSQVSDTMPEFLFLFLFS